jgi:ribonuclease E
MTLWRTIQQQSKRGPRVGIVFQDGDIIMRMIRDYHDNEVDEILVDEEDAFERAHNYFSAILSDSPNIVKHYKDDQPLFLRYHVETQIASVFERKIPLPSGGSIVLDQTEALVAIDVNSGKTQSDSGTEETALKTNLEAAEEIARQLRLRDLGGLIVIDFIGMRLSRNIREVERRFAQAIKQDKARIKVGHISVFFGLLSLSRQRIRESKALGHFTICDHCGGHGKIPNVESSALIVLRKLQEVATLQLYDRAEVRIPSNVAMYMLNHKRTELTELLEEHSLAVEIFPREGSVIDLDEDILTFLPTQPLRKKKSRSPIQASPAPMLNEASPSMTLAAIPPQHATTQPSHTQTSRTQPSTTQPSHGQASARFPRSGRPHERSRPYERAQPHTAHARPHLSDATEIAEPKQTASAPTVPHAPALPSTRTTSPETTDGRRTIGAESREAPRGLTREAREEKRASASPAPRVAPASSLEEASNPSFQPYALHSPPEDFGLPSALPSFPVGMPWFMRYLPVNKAHQQHLDTWQRLQQDALDSGVVASIEQPNLIAVSPLPTAHKETASSTNPPQHAKDATPPPAQHAKDVAPAQHAKDVAPPQHAKSTAASAPAPRPALASSARSAQMTAVMPPQAAQPTMMPRRPVATSSAREPEALHPSATMNLQEKPKEAPPSVRSSDLLPSTDTPSSDAMAADQHKAAPSIHVPSSERTTPTADRKVAVPAEESLAQIETNKTPEETDESSANAAGSSAVEQTASSRPRHHRGLAGEYNRERRHRGLGGESNRERPEYKKAGGQGEAGRLVRLDSQGDADLLPRRDAPKPIRAVSRREPLEEIEPLSRHTLREEKEHSYLDYDDIGDQYQASHDRSKRRFPTDENDFRARQQRPFRRRKQHHRH